MGRTRSSLMGILALVALLGTCQMTVDPNVTIESAGANTSTTLGEPRVPPGWLGMTLRYSQRHSLGKRRLDALTTNNGPEEIVVSLIALRAGHFRPLAPEVKNSHIGPGMTVAVKADFGALVDCGSDQVLEANVLIDIASDGASPISYRVPVDAEPLDRIRDIECSELAVEQAAEVTFGDEWTVEGSRVRAELVFTHLGGEETVVVEAVAGQILFGMQPRPPMEPPLAILEPGGDAVTLPVEMALIRCDTHAVSQAPDGYAFRVWMAVGDRDPFAIAVLASQTLQSQLEELVDVCLGV